MLHFWLCFGSLKKTMNPHFNEKYTMYMYIIYICETFTHPTRNVSSFDLAVHSRGKKPAESPTAITVS